MNANLLINSISFPLAANKLDEVKRFLLNLPWENKPSQLGIEKVLVGPKIFGRWSEVIPTKAKSWFMSIELTVGDYYILFRCHEYPDTEFKNKISWRKTDEVLASSKEW